MINRYDQVTRSKFATVCFIGTAAIGLISAGFIGCGSGTVSPFLAAQFNGTIGTFPGVGPGVGAPGGGGMISNTINCYCELLENERDIDIRVFNCDPDLFVTYRILLVVSADRAPDPAAGIPDVPCTDLDGDSIDDCVTPRNTLNARGRLPGFLPSSDEVLDRYLDPNPLTGGQYEVLIPTGSPIGTTATVGCVELTLDRGDQLLVREIGSFNLIGGEDPIMNNPALGDPMNPNEIGFNDPTLNIPTPEYIVFTTDAIQFTCSDESQECSQAAFRYTDMNGFGLVGDPFPDIDSTRIQGTRCFEAGVEDPSVVLDFTRTGGKQDFEFAPGATIDFAVLIKQNVAQIVPGQPSVVWRMLDALGNLVDAPPAGQEFSGCFPPL